MGTAMMLEGLSHCFIVATTRLLSSIKHLTSTTLLSQERHHPSHQPSAPITLEPDTSRHLLYPSSNSLAEQHAFPPHPTRSASLGAYGVHPTSHISPDGGG